MTSSPMVLDLQKKHYGGDHVYTYVRASHRHGWEQVLEVCGMVLMWTLSTHGCLYLSWLDFDDLAQLYRTNFYVGECVMWTCFFNTRPDWGVKLPTLRTLAVCRLMEREELRQEEFDKAVRRACGR